MCDADCLVCSVNNVFAVLFRNCAQGVFPSANFAEIDDFSLAVALQKGFDIQNVADCSLCIRKPARRTEIFEVVNRENLTHPVAIVRKQVYRRRKGNSRIAEFRRTQPFIAILNRAIRYAHEEMQ